MASAGGPRPRRHHRALAVESSSGLLLAIAALVLALWLLMTTVVQLYAGLSTGWRASRMAFILHVLLRLRWQRAAVVAETALAFPVLLTAAIGLLQFAVYEHSQNVATEAVQEGARVAAEEDRTVADGVAYAQTLLRTGLGPSAAQVQVSGSDGGNAVAIQAKGQLRLIIPWAVNAGLPLEARAVMSKERFRVGPGSTT